MKTLKQATRSDHEHVESYPVTRALAEGTMTRLQYELLLAGYAACHESLLARLSGLSRFGGVARAPELKPIVDSFTQRVAWLQQDIQALGARSNTRASGFDSTDAFRLQVSSWSLPKVLGACYVFEGAALGNAFLYPRLRESLTLEDRESRYFRGWGVETMNHFRAFGEALSGLLDSDGDSFDGLDVEAEAVVGARQTFSAVGALLEEVGHLTYVPARVVAREGRATAPPPAAFLG